jgi:DNA-binding XRE family transcriptional regulator
MPPKLASDPPTPLRETLERIGMSQAALARALGVDRQNARAWVIGEYTPKPERREQIARVVQAPVEELWPNAERSAVA